MRRREDKLYGVWRTMCCRCHTPGSKDYPHYGGHGIRVCNEWRDDFDAFRDWSLHHGYREGLTLDRICNTRGYNPRNCRWVSRRAQAYNRGTNRRIEYRGEVHTLTVWSEILGISESTIRMRLKRGWPVEKALGTPVSSRDDERAQL